MFTRRNPCLCGLTLLLTAALVTTWTFAQEKTAKEKREKGEKKEKKAEAPAAAAPGTPDPAAMMEQYMAIMTPGEGHKRLEHFVGTWDCTMKMWMGGPGSPPSESKGTMTTKWVLGKRFIHDEFKGEMAMPDASGKMTSVPFEGLGMTGYDNFRNLYVGTWADSMGTALYTWKGSVDPTGKEFNYYGEMDEPELKVIGRAVRYRTRITDDDHHVFEVYDLHAGPDYKVMEMTYARKK